MDRHLVVIAGPTAVGKTSLSVVLAKKFNTEVISADSRQVYKEMNIGTAKPTLEEMQHISHHFIGTHSINDKEPFNASLFEQQALAIINELFEHNKVVIVSGGTGLYIDALCYGFDDGIPPTDEKTRKKLVEIFENEGIEPLQEKLELLDPAFAKQVDMNNPQRLMRAIEVCLVSGRPYSEIRKGKKARRPFNIIKIAIDREREELYGRINHRVDEMIEAGLVDEVRSLSTYFGNNALKTVGYQEIIQFLQRSITLVEAIDKIKTNTRQYAKRQLTWLRRDKTYNWFQADDKIKIVNYINKKINTPS